MTAGEIGNWRFQIGDCARCREVTVAYVRDFRFEIALYRGDRVKDVEGGERTETEDELTRGSAVRKRALFLYILPVAR